MSTHELDRGPRFWIAAAGLAGLAGALLTPGCDSQDAFGVVDQMSAVDTLVSALAGGEPSLSDG